MRKTRLFVVLCAIGVVLAGCGGGADSTATATSSPTPDQSSSDQASSPTTTPVPAATAVPTLSPTATPTIVPVQRLMTGLVVDAVARNGTEIELLQVRDANGKIWQFLTDGPIGIDAGHLLVHRDTNEGVEVVYLEKAGRLFALEVNDLVRQ